jgi:hypothetical protein
MISTDPGERGTREAPLEGISTVQTIPVYDGDKTGTFIPVYIPVRCDVSEANLALLESRLESVQKHSTASGSPQPSPTYLD